MLRIHCRSAARAAILAHTLDSAFPDALTTRTGRTVRTELTRADVASLRRTQGAIK